MKLVVASLLVCLMAAPAMAVIGLPYADGATTSQGEMSVQGGLTFESDMNMYGARFNYGVMDGASVFAGAGMVDVNDMDSALYYQVGGKYQLPMNLPVDLSVRAAFGMTSLEEKSSYGTYELDLWMLNVGALASKAISDMLTVYGFGGISYQNWDVSYSSSHAHSSYSASGSETETELSLAGGILYFLNQNLSFYAELAMIDEMFISGGARFAFGNVQ